MCTSVSVEAFQQPLVTTLQGAATLNVNNSYAFPLPIYCACLFGLATYSVRRKNKAVAYMNDYAWWT